MLAWCCYYECEWHKAWRVDTTCGNCFVYFIATGEYICGVLGVELPEEVYIPRPLDVEFAVSADVDEVVGVVTENAPDGERAFPWRGELVHALLVLDEA